MKELIALLKQLIALLTKQQKDAVLSEMDISQIEITVDQVTGEFHGRE